MMLLPDQRRRYQRHPMVFATWSTGRHSYYRAACRAQGKFATHESKLESEDTRYVGMGGYKIVLDSLQICFYFTAPKALRFTADS